jgi:2-polyprenyl-3-methyl-5-hydroxy-6-metoxy-1,4-benzoquinol methylase
MSSFDIKNFSSRLQVANTFDGNLVHGANAFHRNTNRTGEGRPSSGGMTREHEKVAIDTGKERYQRIDGLWEIVDRCPVCNSERREFFLTRFGLNIYRCNDCSHRYLNPRVKYDEAMTLYADDKTSSDIYSQALQIEIDDIKYQYGIDLIDQLNPPSRKKIMDIGCGAGGFLKMADRNNWQQCVGVDVNERYESIYQETKGVQFISANFESLDPEKLGSDYDCIAMWSVLEHLYDLNGILEIMKRMLKKNGLLFILVPNVDSLATRLMREMSPTFNWKHLSHFSPKSLKHLMNANNFTCEHIETVITEIDNIKSYMSGEYPYYGYGDPDHLFDFITPEYLHRNLLGSRLIGVFRNA